MVYLTTLVTCGILGISGMMVNLTKKTTKGFFRALVKRWGCRYHESDGGISQSRGGGDSNHRSETGVSKVSR